MNLALGKTCSPALLTLPDTWSRWTCVMITTEMLGAFEDDERIRTEFLAAIRS